ncbi:hypothetical protein U7230_07215 [Carboxydochorda subterranea]|uniref:Membrane protein DUF2178 n=1 Tax=Carboxydichorda subterranea TaxID=3109565 RepID=A0ABZ1C190_9FIRM|nr:hypothetical protein [Limnochorda sp. L945t]WRP18773.1 hypothetical protein U7230_07215 [Limnochorda sp. L945t]
MHIGRRSRWFVTLLALAGAADLFLLVYGLAAGLRPVWEGGLLLLVLTVHVGALLYVSVLETREAELAGEEPSPPSWWRRKWRDEGGRPLPDVRRGFVLLGSSALLVLLAWRGLLPPSWLAAAWIAIAILGGLGLLYLTTDLGQPEADPSRDERSERILDKVGYVTSVVTGAALLGMFVFSTATGHDDPALTGLVSVYLLTAGLAFAHYSRKL